MHLKSILIALLPLLSITSTSPVPPAKFLVRSSNEGVYLTNCNEFETGYNYSEMDYYSNAKSGSQNGQWPDATAFVSNGWVTWEGNKVCGNFTSSGETFCSQIYGNAQSLGTGALAGVGSNNQTPFYCYKDNNRNLYTATGIVCNSIYYCFDA